MLVDNDTRIRVWGSGQGAVFYSYLLVGFCLLVGCWLVVVLVVVVAVVVVVAAAASATNCQLYQTM